MALSTITDLPITSLHKTMYVLEIIEKTKKCILNWRTGLGSYTTSWSQNNKFYFLQVSSLQSVYSLDVSMNGNTIYHFTSDIIPEVSDLFHVLGILATERETNQAIYAIQSQLNCQHRKRFETLMSGGIIMSGHYSTVHNIKAQGGITVGGRVVPTDSIQTHGGAVIGGIVVPTNYIPTHGGVNLAGAALVSTTFHNNSSSGAKIGGHWGYNQAEHMSGGVVVSSSNNLITFLNDHYALYIDSSINLAGYENDESLISDVHIPTSAWLHTLDSNTGRFDETTSNFYQLLSVENSFFGLNYQGANSYFSFGVSSNFSPTPTAIKSINSLFTLSVSTGATDVKIKDMQIFKSDAVTPLTPVYNFDWDTIFLVGHSEGYLTGGFLLCQFNVIFNVLDSTPSSWNGAIIKCTMTNGSTGFSAIYGITLLRYFMI